MRKNLIKSDNGSTAIEFALVSLPFFSLVLVILEIGLSTVRQYVLDDTGFKLARCASLIGLDPDRTKLLTEQICPANLPFLKCSSITLGAANVSGGGVVNNESLISAWNIGSADDIIVLELSYPYEPIIPLLKVMPTITESGTTFLYSRNMIRNEPSIASRSGGPC